MVEPKTLVLIVEDHKSQRLDVFLSEHVSSMSRNQLKQKIQQGEILLNQAQALPKTKLKMGDEVKLLFTEQALASTLLPHPMDLTILHEEADFLILNKPKGLVVHPGAGTTEPTLVSGILAHLNSDPTYSSLDTTRPGVVHRLDKDTTGAMVIAKTPYGYKTLSQQIADRVAKRSYLALVDGLLDSHNKSYESYLARDPKNPTQFISVDLDYAHNRFGSQLPASYRWAKSHFKTIKTYENTLSLVEIQLETGRTHQIRVQLKALGCPILGDMIYGKKRDLPSFFSKKLQISIKELNRQMLHAFSLGIVHPKTGKELHFEACLPEDFLILLDNLKPYEQSIMPLAFLERT